LKARYKIESKPTMSLAVDEPIINNHFEEPKGYRIYDKLAAAGKKIEGYLWELEENGA